MGKARKRGEYCDLGAKLLYRRKTRKSRGLRSGGVGRGWDNTGRSRVLTPRCPERAISQAMEPLVFSFVSVREEHKDTGRDERTL